MSPADVSSRTLILPCIQEGITQTNEQPQRFWDHGYECKLKVSRSQMTLSLLSALPAELWQRWGGEARLKF
jgi:hypothetical protein